MPSNKIPIFVASFSLKRLQNCLATPPCQMRPLWLNPHPFSSSPRRFVNEFTWRRALRVPIPNIMLIMSWSWILRIYNNIFVALPRAKDSLTNFQFPKIPSIIQNSRSSYPRCSFRPVWVKMCRSVVVAQVNFLRPVAFAERPLVIAAIHS